MAYYLLVEKENGKQKSLNIGESSRFNSERKFKKPRAHTLQEIDKFTSEFEDEKELRMHLLSERILTPDLESNPLSIRFIKHKRYDSIKYDVLYQDCIEYVMEKERLIELIMKRYYNNDFEFIRRLASYFSNFHECGTTAPEIVCLAEQSIKYGRRDEGFNELDSNGDNMITRLIKLLILKHTEKPNGEIEYKNKCNYRNLHLLISFVLNYDKNLTPIIETTIQIDTAPSVEPQTQIVSKEYTRARKKTPQLNGQISFKDLL